VVMVKAGDGGAMVEAKHGGVLRRHGGERHHTFRRPMTAVINQ
jgi:hypothetical protein